MRKAASPFRHVGLTSAHCVLAALAANAACLAAAEGKSAPASPGATMDYGSLMTYFVSLPEPLKVVVSKAVVVRATPATTFCYDAETMALAAVWQGGFLDMSATCVSRIVQGTGPAPAHGALLLGSGIGPGWAQGGSFVDPREQSLGQLPESWTWYRGLYRHGPQVVVAYSVGDCAVRELPGVVGTGSATVITRTLRLGPSAGEQR
nr:hypothetical protein [Planctomycetota bacterium]